MTTRGEINSNFYQIVNVDANGAPTSVKPEYLPNVGNANYAANAGHANVADVANSVSVSNVSGIGNIATLNLTGSSANVLYGNGIFAAIPTVSNVANANYANYSNVANSANSVAVANVTGIGNIATTNYDGVSTHVLYGNGVWADVTAAPSANANYANFAGTAFSVSGSNVTGYVANATHANVSDSANSVTAANVSGLGNIATVNLTGSTSNVLYGNGVFAAIPTISNVANANFANYAGNAFSVDAANIVGTINLANYATVANSVAGANVSGTVSDASHATVSDSANSVTAANVSGLGNIATLNLTGSSANVLYGNGVFAAIPEVSNVANANYANFAGTAYSVSGSNVSGEVANANYSNYSNIANTANSVSVANVSGIGNIATVNLDGNVSNVLAGDGTWVSTGTAVNANFANYAGNVTVSSQPNITSVGNLINLQLDTTVTPFAANVGQMFWDTTERTVTLGMENGVQQQIGLEQYILVKASSAITNGQVVMFTGADGNNVTAAPANAASAGFKTEYIIGIATEDIANNGFGYITTFGQVHGLNTNAYNVGDILWYDPTSTTGGLTATQPTDPNYQVQMAAVTKKAGGDGHIQVRVTVFNPITRASDVEITTPTTGQALVYNGSNVWINGIPNIANIAYSVSGANVSGEVANANFASYSNVSNTANSVAVANVSGIGNIATLNLDGSTSNVLYGNGTWAAIPTVTSVANANYANYAGNAFSVDAANIVGTVNLANYATVANSVSVGNVSGIGNIATINLTGSTSNVLYGNGVFAAIPAVSNVANANYANYAGNAFSVDAANIVGTVNLANYATVANSVAGANVSGEVANANFASYSNVANSANSVSVANVSGIGNIATVNLTGSTSNVLYGNGAFAPVVATAGGNSSEVQYNVGGSFAGDPAFTFNILTQTLTVGNINANGSQLTSITGANVTGEVSYAAVANSVAVANVSGIGNIATLNLTGSTSNVLYGNGVFAAVTVSSVANANYANFAGNAFSVAGANVVGEVANAQFADVANTVVILNDAANTSNQQVYFGGTGNSRIKYDGSFMYNSNSNTLYAGSIVANANASLLTTGTISSARVVGNYSNITGVGTLNGLNIASGTITTSDPVSLTQTWNLGSTWFTGIDVNITTTAYSSASRLIDLKANSVSKFSVDANGVVQTGNVPAARISGTVANATYAVTAGTANSVAVANVSGIGNIATLNLDGSTSNVLYGNGVFAPVSVTSVANANYANYAGNAFSVDAGNIVGTVNLANYATIANSVAVANVSGIGNIATINLDGNVSNVLSGNGSFVALPTVSANANYANYAGNAFSVDAGNIVGTVNLANYATVANSVAGANVSGEVGFAAVANSVAVANVSGIGNIATINLNGSSSNVLYGNGVWAAAGGSGDANFANYAGNVTVAAQSNITSLGTLTSITTSGNANIGGDLNLTGLGNIGNIALIKFTETLPASANTSTSIAPDLASGTIVRYTANASFSFNGFTSPVAGQSGTVIITQDATGGRTMTSTMKFAGGSKTLSTAANAIDIISVFYDGTTYYAVLTKAFA